MLESRLGIVKIGCKVQKYNCTVDASFDMLPMFRESNGLQIEKIIIDIEYLSRLVGSTQDLKLYKFNINDRGTFLSKSLSLDELSGILSRSFKDRFTVKIITIRWLLH